MLPGEGVDDLVDLEAFGIELHFHFGEAHFVFEADGDGRVFLAEFEEDEAAGVLEGFADGAEHELGLGELVVDVDEEDHVLGIGGEVGFGFGAEEGGDIGDAGRGEALGEEFEHAGLDIDGIDFAGGADEAGHTDGVVAGAGAEVADGHSRFEAKEGDCLGGAFFAFAFRAFEPIGAGGGHDGGDGAATDGVFQGEPLGEEGGRQEEGEEADLHLEP